MCEKRLQTSLARELTALHQTLLLDLRGHFAAGKDKGRDERGRPGRDRKDHPSPYQKFLDLRLNPCHPYQIFVERRHILLNIDPN